MAKAKQAKKASPAKSAKRSGSSVAGRPTFAAARTLYENGQDERAAELLAELVKLTPADHEAFTLYGHALLRLGDSARAESAYQQAVQLEPRALQAHINLGVVFAGRGNYAAAAKAFEAAIELVPDHAIALRNYGGVLRNLGKLAEAEATLRRAIALAPEDGGAQTNLGLVLCDLGRNDEALVHLRAAVDLSPSSDTCHHALLFNMNYALAVAPEEVAAAHRRYGAMIEARCPEMPRPPVAVDRPLRVGFVSGDLRRHSVAFFLEPLLAHLPAHGYELHAYSTCDVRDEITVRLRERFVSFSEVHGLSDRALADKIRADGIDILIDLHGHTRYARLGVFAHRPAAVQLTYLGYPNTTGLSRIDYRVSDEESDPTGLAEAFHSEQLMRLPGGFLCFHPPQPCPKPAAPPSTTGAPLTFGSFNALPKLSDRVLGLWVKLLGAAPDARLYIKCIHLSSPTAYNAFEARLRALGAPLERIELAGKIPDSASHLAAYHRVDVALDAYPYHGTTTTFEALWMGVPVVSLVGRTHVSRVGVSLLQRTGLGDLLADDEDGYVARALALGRDVSRRVELRHGLRERMERAGMLDGARIARELGEAMNAAYARYAAAAPRTAQAAAPAKPNEVVSTTALGPTYTITGNLRVVGPSRDEFVGYVLDEQADWHEQELAFVRRLLQVGERALDLGSGHGVYAVSMAALVGPRGSVRAVTRRALDAARLRESAHLNGFPQLSAGAEPAYARVDGAVFARIAAAELPEHSLPALLEACLASDPLVMVNLIDDPAGAAAVVEALRARGLAGYRLLPGLGVLYPAAPSEALDGLLCNVFLCSPARARTLEERGLLARPLAQAEPPMNLSLEDFFRSVSALQQLDVAASFRNAVGGRFEHREALRHFAWSCMLAESPSARAFALRRALDHALRASDEPTELARYATLARVAGAWGERKLSVEAADTALAIHKAGKARLREAGLPACPRYDAYLADSRFGELLLSSLLEQRERGAAHSSYFTRGEPQSLVRLLQLERLGFQTTELARRLAQVRRYQDALRKVG